ncbi:hypothetical protein [Steroidobacter sp.]|uniref:hypothetical protein n=1 Tax=Steroidobacter sp. TaxID=1978227 RepID=UPI001A4659B0|nr:hypothetical protein [Steroidobacter sp.]MBL8268960.1 hypothetical protein [Steroidobacter sp.]
MPNDPDDIDRWTDALAGRPAEPLPDHQARSNAALRAAVKADEAAAQAAGAADDIGRTRLLKRLEQEGLLESTVSTAAPRKRTLQVWLGAAAAVLVAAIGLHFAMTPDPSSQDPATQWRGIAGTVRVNAENPDASAQQIETQLRSLELAPRRLPGADPITIEVAVDTQHLAAFRHWAKPLGGRVLAPGIYRVLVEPAKNKAPAP